MSVPAHVAPASPSAPSIAPVGLEEVVSTLQIRLPMRRARLRRVVIAAVSACALILVAAGIVKVVHASSEPSSTPRTASAANAAPGATPIAAAAIAPGLPAAAPAPDTASASAATTGTLRLERNLTPRLVLLDGRKLGTRSEAVTCGPHQLKVGRSKSRAIDIPCGGELRVAR
jgi:hypothetical protein